MILGQIAWVDCFAFLIFLAPQLIIQVGLLKTAATGIRALPFLRSFQRLDLNSIIHASDNFTQYYSFHSSSLESGTSQLNTNNRHSCKQHQSSRIS